MLELGDVAGQAQIPITQHSGVINPFGYMTAGRSTSGQVQVHVFCVRRDRWFLVARLAVYIGFVMICMTTFTVCLRP